MKKRLKGFTLIECLVALAVLGVASLTMAQIYAAVSTRNKMNHLVNTSLSNQMAYVEKKTDSATVTIKYNNGAAVPDANKTKPPHKTSVSQNNNYITVIKGVPGADADAYSFPVDVYVLKSRDRNDNVLTSDGGYSEADYNLRYKYILGHTS